MTAGDQVGAKLGRHRDRGERRQLLYSRLTAWVSALISLQLMVSFHRSSWSSQWTVETAFFVLVSLMFVLMLTLSANGRSFRMLPVAQGKVVALVPSYNENPFTLQACMQPLLNGTVVPDVIHVVDDGSVTPVLRFEHPRVVASDPEPGEARRPDLRARPRTGCRLCSHGRLRLDRGQVRPRGDPAGHVGSGCPGRHGHLPGSKPDPEPDHPVDRP